MTNSMIDFLLNPIVVIFFIVVFALSAGFLVVRRKNLSITHKVVFGILCAVCVVYFAFILWVIIMSGNSHPAYDPISISNQ